MQDHVAKVRIYEQLARLGKALAAPGRLELLDLLGTDHGHPVPGYRVTTGGVP